MYAKGIEYKPIIDLSKINPRMWIDYSYGIMQNALHKYYCTGNVYDFANSKVYDAHYEVLHYKFRQKELDDEVAIELTAKLISRLYTNIIDKGYQVNPIAYRTYVDQAMKYVLIDYIRYKRGKPIALLYADPQLAVLENYNSSMTIKEFESEIHFTPEDVISVKDIDKQLITTIRKILDIILCKGGSGQLLYFVYHYYINRDENIFKTMPQYYINKCMLVLRMVEHIIPYNEYISLRNKKDELYA